MIKFSYFKKFLPKNQNEFSTYKRKCEKKAKEERGGFLASDYDYGTSDILTGKHYREKVSSEEIINSVETFGFINESEISFISTWYFCSDNEDVGMFFVVTKNGFVYYSKNHKIWDCLVDAMVNKYYGEHEKKPIENLTL